MTSGHANLSDKEWHEEVAGHWRLYLIEGIVLMILGAGAVIIPAWASLVATVFLGWLFLVGGGVGLLTTLLGRHAPGNWWALASAVVTMVAGFLLIGWPFVGVVSLTLILAAYLAADGVLTILFAFEHRHRLSRRWGWLLVNGILDLVLAGLIVWVLPQAAFWVFGLIVGIDFIFGGASLIAMAFATHRDTHAQA